MSFSIQQAMTDRVGGLLVLVGVLGLCGLGVAEETEHASSEPTYWRDIAPILQEHCESCHRPGQIAPMSLTSYKEVRPWAKGIAKAVSARTMPPFFAGGPIGRFEGDTRLTDAEIETIVEWVAAGARRGNPGDAPARRLWGDFTNGIAEPELVLEYPTYAVPAEGAEEYVHLLNRYRFPEDTWVRGIDFRVSDQRHLHHAGVYLLDEGYAFGEELVHGTRGLGMEEGMAVLDEIGKHAEGTLFVWGPGYGVESRPEGHGLMIPKGSAIGIQAHFATTGEPGATSIALAFDFADGVLTTREDKWVILMRDLRIPPGVASHVERRPRPHEPPYRTLGPVRILGYWVHMHSRGKSASILFHRPDGVTVNALDIPAWNVDWQPSYMYREPVVIPANTRMEYVAEWDNSAENPLNPDPSQVVEWGITSGEEMYGATVYLARDMETPIVVERGIEVSDVPVEGR